MALTVVVLNFWDKLLYGDDLDGDLLAVVLIVVYLGDFDLIGDLDYEFDVGLTVEKILDAILVRLTKNVQIDLHLAVVLINTSYFLCSSSFAFCILDTN